MQSYGESHSMLATLLLLSGPEAGRRHEFGETEIVIGREAGCHVVLDQPEISRKHASVYFQDGCYWLKRTGRNLTSVNGMEIGKDAPVALADGDRIGICDVLMEFRCALPLADDDENRLLVEHLQPSGRLPRTPSR